MIAFGMMMALLMMATAQCPSRCHCSSYKTYCVLARLNRLPEHLKSTTEWLRIEHDHITELKTEMFSIYSDLKYLTCLELKNVHLQKIHPRAFRILSQLESLILSKNEIKQLDPYSFEFLDNLCFLDLSYNSMKFLGSEPFYGLKNLRHLSIIDSNIQYMDSDVFSGIRNGSECDIINTPMKLDLSLNTFQVIEYEFVEDVCAFNIIDLGTIMCKNMQSIFPKLTKVTKLVVSLLRYSNRVIELNKSIMDALHSLKYLDMSSGDITSIETATFQNFGFLQYLDLSLNHMRKVKPGSFIGSISLKVLKLNNNKIYSLVNNTFKGLESLIVLNVSSCRIKIIEPGACNGLHQLRILDLSHNRINTLSNSTFFGAVRLKELKLEYNNLQHIEIGAFAGLFSLKQLLNYADQESDITCSEIGEQSLQMLTRLDVIGLNAHFTAPPDVQALKSLNLCINFTTINIQEMQGYLLQYRVNATDLKLTILELNYTSVLHSFLQIPFSTLNLIKGTLSILNSDSFPISSQLSSLTIADMNINIIQMKTFHRLKSLSELKLMSLINVTIEEGAFEGINSLTLLKFYNIQFDTLPRGIFDGLYSLKILYLSHNNIANLTQGVFSGLNNVKHIDLSYNKLSLITEGVFGAVCLKEFRLSCKNATLASDYCNVTSALSSLQHLNLAYNAIMYIHPRAFLSCNRLRTLDLSNNNLKTQDNNFLFTPELQYINLEFTQILKIPVNLFECTPLLSVINLSFNHLKTINVTSIQHLKQLKTIDISLLSLECDCEMYKTWQWFQEHQVSYETWIISTCNFSYLEAYVTNLVCNDTEDNEIGHRLKFGSNDFEFFRIYIEPIVLIIVFLLGISTNGFLLFIVFCHSDMCLKQNACLINLAVVDILSLLFSIPLSYFDILYVTWELGETMCKIFIMSKEIIISANIFSVVALSVERCAVASTFDKIKSACSTTPQLSSWFLMMVWTTSIIICLPAYHFATVHTRCLSFLTGNEEYIKRMWTFQLVVCCLIPCISITVVNLKTSQYLERSIRNIPGEIRNNSNIKNRSNVSNMVIVLTIVFIISYVPNFLLRVLVAWSIVNIENILLISFFSFCLFFCNTVFNPISIFIISSKFKSYASNYFRILQNQQMSNKTRVKGNPRPFSVTDRVDDDIKQIQQARMERLSRIQERHFSDGYNFCRSTSGFPEDRVEL